MESEKLMICQNKYEQAVAELCQAKVSFCKPSFKLKSLCWGCLLPFPLGLFSYFEKQAGAELCQAQTSLS